MDGYKICVYKITTNKDIDSSCYGREGQEEIYEQKVEELNLKNVIAVVNGLNTQT